MIVCADYRSEHAGMMELVDMRDLGSRVERRWGSSPHARTKKPEAKWTPVFVFVKLCAQKGIASE